MSRPEPKYAVGEAVMVRCEKNPRLNTDHSVVLRRTYGKCMIIGSGEIIMCWSYELNVKPDGFWVSEKSLRPTLNKKSSKRHAAEFIQKYIGARA